MDTAGAILGPLLGLGIFALLLGGGLSLEGAYRGVFFCAALPTVVSIGLTLTRLREVRTLGEPIEEPSTGKAERAAPRRALLFFTVISCLFSLWAVTENFMLVSGAQILNIQAEEIWPVVILYWFINVTFAPTALLAGRLSDLYGRKPFIVTSFLVLAALTMLFAFAGNFWQVGLLFALHGVYQGLLKPSQTALVADLAPPEARGEALGKYAMWVGLFVIPAPFLFGLLWDLMSWQAPFVISGLFIAVCALLLALFVHPAE
jgi:MFS family permease